jgi:hypothetical protein
MLPASLATSADVLSSVVAFMVLICIIGKKWDDVKGKAQKTLVLDIALDQPLNLH